MKTLLLLGDSLIEYGDWQGAFPASRCLNFGIAGETVDGLLQRLPAVIKRVGVADAILVMTGTNNLAMDDFYFVPEYEKILLLLTCVTPPTKILATSLLPVDFPWQPSTLVPNLNAHLKEMCSRLSARPLPESPWSFPGRHDQGVDSLCRRTASISISRAMKCGVPRFWNFSLGCSDVFGVSSLISRNSLLFSVPFWPVKDRQFLYIFVNDDTLSENISPGNGREMNCFTRCCATKQPIPMEP